MDPNTWGDLATWVTATVTLGALVAAIVAVRRSGELLQIEQERDKARDKRDADLREAAERAEQADLVAAWPYDVEDFGPLSVQLTGSSLPVYDVELEFVGPSGVETEELGLLPPGTQLHDWPQWMHDGEGTLADFRVALSFRDTAGRVWRRNEYGVLRWTGITVYPQPITSTASMGTPAISTTGQPEAQDDQRE
ncbi:hypothetical protein GCM10009641_86610 [Mycobacterium cookii]|uniref:Uncharacterized protein n=1 Tax=Nocardioides furvisabuli TaxID=375542 RepID=A0ABP5I731_9ACTN|nr:hypothetical protein [Nocardioides furvisabuli]